jgi:hypothetical protein
MTVRALTVRGPVRVARYTKPAVTLAVGVASAIAVASSVLFIIALIVAGVHLLFETPPMRRRLARRADRRGRHRRRDEREARLEAACVSTFELAELSDIVDSVVEGERGDPFDLEPLLDRYCDLAIAHYRCAHAAQPIDAACLEARLAAAKEAHLKTVAILERRVRQNRMLTDRARTLDQAINELAELIRYCGERSALPEVAPLLESDLVTNALDYCDAQDQL